MGKNTTSNPEAKKARALWDNDPNWTTTFCNLYVEQIQIGTTTFCNLYVVQFKFGLLVYILSSFYIFILCFMMIKII